MGKATRAEAWVAQFAVPHIVDLSLRLVWPIDLLVFDNDSMLIVESTQRTSPFSIDRNMVGQRWPILMTSSGRAYLAHVAAHERSSIVERLRNRDTAEGELARDSRGPRLMVKQVRQAGCATREGGLFPHTKSISVPVVAKGQVTGCLTIVWIASALTLEEGAMRFATELKSAAALIVADLERDGEPGDRSAPTGEMCVAPHCIADAAKRKR
ncbi:IclR family transcriptional regulator domain-containing protein [Azospirillum lipoferum]|uniref:IclR family transcriptional regulator domain-containing protein n=1 Tax=Azospirillum lipoferum TaxID=193 RepID=UPI003CCC5DFB